MDLLLLTAVALLGLNSAFAIGGGHYKIRAPPPPPVPPAGIHYGSYPPPLPPHRTISSAASYAHPSYRSPPHPHYSHYPRSPYSYHKSNPREYHHRLAAAASYYHPKIATPYVPAIPALPAINANSYPIGIWANYNAFRAPAVKESFNPSPSAQSYTSTIHQLRDDDRGPIHTIPAPNLGGGPDAAHIAAAASQYHSHHSHHSHNQKKIQDPEADLVAVLRHGITNVNVPHSSAYQAVTEDPSIHTPEKDTPLHFAPDPDPSTPTLKVPATNDPHSIPSNGQVPLDIYLQKEADKQAASTEASNALTEQDLFNLLNYQPAPASPVVPPFPVYNSESLLQQQSQQTYTTPHFQTFNYDERTQQGAYGSNSFPPSSMSLELGNTDLSGGDELLDLKNFQDNDLAGSDKNEVFLKLIEADNEIDQKREEPKKKSLEKKESTHGKNEFVSRTTKHPNDLQTDGKFEIRVPQDVKDKIKKEILTERNVPCPPGTSCVLPVATLSPESKLSTEYTNDNGVQLQKSIQIFSTTYSTSMNEAAKSAEVSTSNPKKARGIDVIANVASLDDSINPQSDPSTANLPFGARIRPKRY